MKKISEKGRWNAREIQVAIKDRGDAFRNIC